MPEIRTDRVRLAILIRRKPGMSAEDFHTYWRTKHAGIFTSIDIVKKNLLYYEQVCHQKIFSFSQTTLHPKQERWRVANDIDLEVALIAILLLRDIHKFL